MTRPIDGDREDDAQIGLFTCDVPLDGSLLFSVSSPRGRKRRLSNDLHQLKNQCWCPELGISSSDCAPPPLRQRLWLSGIQSAEKSCDDSGIATGTTEPSVPLRVMGVEPVKMLFQFAV